MKSLTLFIILSLQSATLSIIFAPSPLSLGIWVIFITLLITLLLARYFPSWFALLVFLIYIGGLLVIFSYFVAIQPNQQLGILKMLIMSAISIIYYYIYLSPFLLKFPRKLKSLKFPVRIIISKPKIFIIILIGISLFLALVVVVKITSSSKSPLRPFSSYV